MNNAIPRKPQNRSGCFTEINFKVFIRTETPCGTGFCSDVSFPYETGIGTSASVRPLLEAFCKIYVDTDIPFSVGLIS